jgi:hypothetical protein
MKLPLYLGDLTAEWLTEALLSTGVLAAARVTAYEAQPLIGVKGMTGQLVRLRLAYDRDEPAAPRTLVAKFSAPDPDDRALIDGMGFYEREVRFYGELAAQTPIRTPRCYFGALDPSEAAAILLLEDLGTAGNGSTLDGCSIAEAEVAMRGLAALHAAWWQSSQLADAPWLELRSLVSVEQAPVFFQQAWEPFLIEMGTQTTDEIRELGAWLLSYLAPLSAYLYEGAPHTLIHNDFHGDNLFFAGEGASLSLVAIDWQLATRGRALLDVTSFLGGNLATPDRRAHEQRLLQTYHALLIEKGVRDFTFAQCWEEYRLAMVQPVSRAILVVGLGGTTPEQTRAYCDVIIPRFCQAAHDLKADEALRAAFGERANQAAA